MAQASKTSKMSGIEKAATLLVALGEEASTLVLKKLTTEELKRLGSCMGSIQEVKREVMTDLMKEFNEMFQSEGDLYTQGDHFFRNLLPRVVDFESANDVISRIDKENEAIPFKSVRDIDPKVLAGFIKNEHPQTIAIILAHIEAQKAGLVLSLLSEPLQLEVTNRIARLETVPPDLIREVDEVLEQELIAVGKEGSQMLGGIQKAAEILNSCDKRTEASILSAMEEFDADLAERVRKLMFVFEDLVFLPDAGIRELLKEVRSEDLSISLKTASDELKKKVFKNLSKRAAEILEDELGMLGPVRLSDVEGAQQNVITIAKRLEKEGKLVLGSGEGGDTFV